MNKKTLNRWRFVYVIESEASRPIPHFLPLNCFPFYREAREAKYKLESAKTGIKYRMRKYYANSLPT